MSAAPSPATTPRRLFDPSGAPVAPPSPAGSKGSAGDVSCAICLEHAEQEELAMVKGCDHSYCGASPEKLHGTTSSPMPDCSSSSQQLASFHDCHCDVSVHSLCTHVKPADPAFLIASTCSGCGVVWCCVELQTCIGGQKQPLALLLTAHADDRSELHPPVGGAPGAPHLPAVQAAVRAPVHVPAPGRRPARLPGGGVGDAAQARRLVHQLHAGARRKPPRTCS